jgi:integrase
MYAAGKLVVALGADKPLAAITVEDMEAMFASLGELKPATRSIIFRTLTTFWKWTVTRGYVERSPMEGMDRQPVPETKVAFPSDPEMRRILATCRSRSQHAYRAHRDEAIIRLLAATGCRLSEVAELKVRDVDLLSQTVTVMGKGSGNGKRERTVPFDDVTAEALRVYIARERPRSPFVDAARLWLGPKGPMTDSGIAQLFAARCAEAGVQSHVHALRHRFVANMLRAGLPEPYVMALTGHTSPSMMVRYGKFKVAENAAGAYHAAYESGRVPKL